MSKLVSVALGSLAALTICATLAAAQSQNQQTQSTTTKKSTSTKKPSANPKKPAEAKNSGDPDKVKIEERMSTRGLKPPPKDAGKGKPAKPESPPKP